jgi:hypothetical protein
MAQSKYGIYPLTNGDFPSLRKRLPGGVNDVPIANARFPRDLQTRPARQVGDPSSPGRQKVFSSDQREPRNHILIQKLDAMEMVYILPLM